MTQKERKKYLINRCYSAQYAKLPDVFKEVNILRYPGLWISIIANSELFNIQNLTPECTDVLLNTKGGYSADLENLEYTMQVFYELNYNMFKLRFFGDEVFEHPDFEKIVKITLRLPKIKFIEVLCSGNILPTQEQIQVLRNPGMTAVLPQNGTKTDEISAIFEQHEVNFEVREEEKGCKYAPKPHTVFVEGKVFRCPLTAEKYADGGEVDEKLYVDIVARKLEIKDLRLALFDITNDPPQEVCSKCGKK